MIPIGLGLVGAGAYGAFCLAAFAELAETRIVAICDNDRARAEHFAAQYNAAAYTHIEPFLADPALALVALNTPPFLHAPQGMLALRAGKHLFCEKPLALTLAEGEALLSAAQQGGARLTVDYVMRRNPLWQWVAAARASGVLGPLLYASLVNHAAGLDLPAQHWFWDKAQSGGIWVEHGVHFFDAFAWVIGAQGHIVSAQSFADGDGREDRVQALARYGDVAVQFYHGFTHNSHTERTTAHFAFASGYVTLHEWVPTHMELNIPAALAPQILPTLPTRWPTQRRAHKNMLQIHISLGFGKSAIYQQCIQEGLRELARAARHPELALSVSGEHALASLKLALDAEEAGQRARA